MLDGRYPYVNRSDSVLASHNALQVHFGEHEHENVIRALTS
jgi:hypothetical protein